MKKYAKLQFIHSDNGDWSKTAKIIKVIGLQYITSPECVLSELEK